MKLQQESGGRFHFHKRLSIITLSPLPLVRTHTYILGLSFKANVLIENFSPSLILLRVIKWAHKLAHKNVLNMQLKQWMQCMQCEILRKFSAC